ncbi:tetratricopeptide repeat protein [Streptomyces griseosporeus]|uniref:tetratricopeptide repeat protein n=1 Tax=Streptomyces griseosporeus TaxID=1910 RepID=UPI0036FBEE92
MAAERRTGQKARTQGNITQIAGDVHLQAPPPVTRAEAEWPVWVGKVPQLAAAFQPRTPVREAIARARAESGDVVLSQVLAGDGGVGKSQLAAALARELRDQERSADSGLDLLVWANATDPDQIITAYADAAGRLGLPGGTSGDIAAAAEAFLAWLPTTDRRWLIVLDDITDPEAVDPWWPDGNHRAGWVLATTRRSDALLSGQGRKLIRLDLYTPEEARAYLQRRLTDAGHPGLYDAEAADALAEELGRLPLGLGHAAAYMINKRCGVGDYLRLFRDTGNALGDLLPPSADAEGYGRPVTTALLVSRDAVRAADPTGLAWPLLQFIALMDPMGHPAELWTTEPVREFLRAARPARRRRLRQYRPAVTPEEIGVALECLRTYALIAQDTARAPIRVHALTGRAVRETIAAQALPGLARTAAHALIAIWPNPDQNDLDLSAALRANAMALDHHTHPCLWTPRTHTCIYEVSSSLTNVGLTEQALEFDRRVLLQSLELHGSDHPDTLTACNNLAVSCHGAGHLRQALELAEHALAEHERLLGRDHRNTLACRNNLAGIYKEAGRAREALELAEQVLADHERILGPEHHHTLGCRDNLATMYGQAGRKREALELAELALGDHERILGPHHPNTVACRSNLTLRYLQVGRVREALELADQVLTECRRILGPDHPYTHAAQRNLTRIREAHETAQPDQEPSPPEG